MAGFKPVGARQEAIADLQRQISMATRMCKKLRSKKVSWKLGTKWIANHLDVLVEQAKEIGELPEDVEVKSSHNGASQLTDADKNALEDHAKKEPGTSNHPRSGKQHQAPVSTTK